MRINNINYNDKATFQGRFQDPGKNFFSKKIANMYYYERVRIETKLNEKEQRKLPTIEKSLFTEIKELFFPKKVTPQEPTPVKPLIQFWDEAIATMKEMVETKLPDEYVLRCKNTSLGNKYMSFYLTKEKEHIYGASATIESPDFPVGCIKRAVDVLSNPDEQKKLQELREIIPNLTEHDFICAHDMSSTRSQMLNSLTSNWIELNKQFKQVAEEKGLNLKIELKNNNEYRIYKSADVTLTDKNNQPIHKGNYNIGDIDLAKLKLENSIKNYTTTH